MADGSKRAFSLIRHTRSLSFRYVALIVTIVVISGLLLGAVATMTSVRNAAEERRTSLEYSGRVVAGALMPVIADQDPTRVQAQLASILSTNEGLDIQCIEIIDVTGEVIAETENGCTCDLVPPSTGLLDVFTRAQVVRVPIEVDGLPVATVSIQFHPVGLESAVWEPLRSIGVVLLLAMLVAAVWGAWVVLRTVVEPIGELCDAANQIAEGSRDVRLSGNRRDEIGDLAHALDDMTDQLQAKERELMESYSSLELAFNDKALLARRLERTMTMKSDFVAVASHELRSPLAVIQLYAEMLEDNEFGDLAPHLAEAIESILSAVTRLSSIVSNLMDVSLLERGLMPLEYADVVLEEIVEQATADAQLIAAERDIDLRLDGALPEVTLRGDAVRLRQAIDNLLSNAIKYSDGGDSVRVRMTEDVDSVVISISDTGRGIRPERAEVLFELFGRADTADNADVPGLGLGLPISARIVKAHGGDITFAANPTGRGTVFEVRLPKKAAAGPDTISVV